MAGHTLSAFTPKLQRNLSVQKTANALDNARKRNRGLTETVKRATSPIRTTSMIQAGAALSGIGLTMRPDLSTAYIPGIAIAAIGAWTGSIDAVNFANGILAPCVAVKAGDAFQRWRNKERTADMVGASDAQTSGNAAPPPAK